MNTSNDSSSKLFERIPPKTDVIEWTEALRSESISEEIKSSLSVLVFRLGEDFFALKTICIKEVAKRRRVHCIPHRSGATLLGMVNLNGEVQLCISLHHFLDVATSVLSAKDKTRDHKRMIAMAKDGDLWVFPVDGVEGVVNVDLAAVENVPVNIAKSTVNYISGMLKVGNKTVGLIDDELLFTCLKRSLT